MQEIHLTLKAARVNRGLTQQQASSKLGVSPDVISNWERCKSFPRALMIKEIEKLYKIPYNQIIFLPNKSD